MNPETQTLSAAPLVRVGIIGDVHAQNAVVSVALDFLRGLPDLDAILCSGDLVTGDGDANQAVSLLRGANVVTVRGNHDRWFGHDYYRSLTNATEPETFSEENLAFAYSLPPTRVLETVSGQLLLCHGVGDDDMAGFYPGGANDEVAWVLQTKELTKYRYLVAGHTHARMVRPVAVDAETVTTLINAGTLLPDNKPGFLVCDFAQQTTTVFHITLPDTVSEGQTVSLRAAPNNTEPQG